MATGSWQLAKDPLPLGFSQAAKLGKQLTKDTLPFDFSQVEKDKLKLCWFLKTPNLGKQLTKDPLPFGFSQRKKEENFIQKKSFKIAFIHFLKNLI
jgi:hypothetical protein